MLILLREGKQKHSGIIFLASRLLCFRRLKTNKKKNPQPNTKPKTKPKINLHWLLDNNNFVSPTELIWSRLALTGELSTGVCACSRSNWTKKPQKPSEGPRDEPHGPDQTCRLPAAEPWIQTGRAARGAAGTGRPSSAPLGTRRSGSANAGQTPARRLDTSHPDRPRRGRGSAARRADPGEGTGNHAAAPFPAADLRAALRGSRAAAGSPGLACGPPPGSPLGLRSPRAAAAPPPCVR